MKPSVLFLTPPNVALFLKKDKTALGLSMGPAFLAGSVKNEGWDADVFDLNLALNRLRPSSLSPIEVAELLANPVPFQDLFHGKRQSQVIDEWVQTLADLLPKKPYLAICFSLDRREYRASISKACFSFALLLARELKKRYNCAIIFGGRRVLNMISQEYVEALLASLDKNPVDKISYKDIFGSLTKFLQAYSEGMDLHSETARDFLQKDDPITELGKIVPVFKPNNADDILARPDDILPIEVRKHYPQLEDVEPFLIAPYVFSTGCPFTCAFCQSGGKNSFSQVKPDHLVNMFYELKKTGVTDFAFYNNNINLNRFFLKSLHEGLKEANVKIQFSDSANLQNADTDMFQLLSNLGAIKLWFGTEALSDRILAAVGKKLTVKEIKDKLKISHDHQIWNCSNLIYNFPHETDEEFDAMIEFCEKFEYVDTFEMNEYRLEQNSQMFDSPEDYGLKLREVSANGLVAVFDEINGLSWEEKREKGKVKTRRMHLAQRSIDLTLCKNDLLLYALRKVGFDKMACRKVFSEYEAYLKGNKLWREYVLRSNYGVNSKVHEQYFPVQNQTIDGHDYKSQILPLLQTVDHSNNLNPSHPTPARPTLTV